MLTDALVVFLEVALFLVVGIVALWTVAKLLGYVASLFEGEPLLPTIKADIESTRREVRRLWKPGRDRRRMPSPG